MKSQRSETIVAFYKAPRYLFRKLNILRLLKKYSYDIDTFIDVGCGAGELACTLAESGKSGVGTDFSQNAIATANAIQKQRHIDPNKLKFIKGDGIKVAKQKFDLVICCEVLEHVKDDAGLLKNLISLSKKYVLISVPAKQRLYDSSDAAVGHFRRYQKADLLNLIGSNNLEIIDFSAYGYPFTNIVRLLRKAAFRYKYRGNRREAMEERSKESGINPVKLPPVFSKLDIEKLIWPFYSFSRLFNKTNLSEGYLVLCKKKSS